MKKIIKNINISASTEKVWEVLQKDAYTRQWYAQFMEGSHAVTDWKEGSQVAFLDPNKDGLIGKVATSKPGELLEIEYTGIANKGIEDFDSPEAQALKGEKEVYKISSTQGSTRLDIEAGMGEEYFDFMSSAWDKALEKIKELSESN